MMKYGLMLCLEASVSRLPDETTVQFDITFLSAFVNSVTLNQHLNFSAMLL